MLKCLDELYNNLNPFKSTPFNPHSVGSFVNVTMDNLYSNCGLLCRSDINREIPRKNSWDLLFSGLETYLLMYEEVVIFLVIHKC